MVKKIIILLFVFILFLSSNVLALTPPSQITSMVNMNSYGFKDGSIDTAQFRFPNNLVLSDQEIIYLSDTKNHRIRAISKGKVWTVSGTTLEMDEYGVPVGGFKDGTADVAQFNLPKGIAINKDGFLFVADSGNNAIRVITPEGTVNTLLTDLHAPSDLVLDQDNNLYISDTLHHQILKYSSDNVLSVLAGGNSGEDFNGGLKDGLGEEALFNEPTGLAIDNDGHIYVADTGNQRIRKITKGGYVTTVAGSGTDLLVDSTYLVGGLKDGIASEAQFNFPQGLTVTADNTIFVADTYNHAIRKISATGDVSTIAGTGKHGNKNGFETHAQFDIPTDIVIDQDNNLLVTDQLNHTIRKIKPYQLPVDIKTEEHIQVIINDQVITFDVLPSIKNGRTFLHI